MSKRNWQVSNTINFDVLRHHQKRSEWRGLNFQRVLLPEAFLPSPHFTLLPLPYLQQGRPGAGWVSKSPNQALSAGKSPGYEKKTLPASAEFAFPLRAPSCICMAPLDYRHPSYFSTNNFSDQQLYSFLLCKKPERQTVPRATPVTIPKEANKLSKHSEEEEDLTLQACKPDHFGFLPQLEQTDSSK